MTILGIDYGRRKLGFSLSAGSLATPYQVLRISSWQEALAKVAQVVQVEKVEKIVVGISEGEMAKEQKVFVQRLARVVAVVVVTWDETLTTKQAQILAKQSGLRQKKRREFEDAYAATVMLQSYLETHGQKGT